MAFNPEQPFNLQYKKGRGTTAVDAEFSPNRTPTNGEFSISGVPNWLTVIEIAPVQGDNNRTVRFAVKTNIADSLSSGVYTADVRFNYRYNKFANLNLQVTETATVNLNVLETVDLNISPTVFSFAYTVGAAAPNVNYLDINSENAWTIEKDQSWIVLNRNSGSNNATIQIGVDVTGLAAGSYSGRVLVDDGYTPKIATVNLTISAATTPTNVIKTNVTQVPITVQQGADTQLNRSFKVTNTDVVSITTDVPWLTTDNTSLPAGTNQTVRLYVADYANLTVGVYEGVITISNANGTVQVKVLVTVMQANVEGIKSNQFYYAKDRNEIQLVSTLPESELKLEFSTDVGANKYIYKKLAPFFKSVARSILGAEANNLVQHKEFNTAIVTGVTKAIDVLNMKITAFDKIKNSTQQTLRETYTGVKVCPGASPKIPGFLSNVPAEIFCPPNGYVCFNYRSDTGPKIIQVGTPISKNYAVQDIDGDVFNVMVNLAPFNLKKGQVISITSNGFSVRANITDAEPEVTPIVFLNEWYCPEVYTASGHITISKQRDQQTTTYYKNGVQHTEVLETKTPYKYSVNTGFIYTEAQRQWLSKILESPKIWLWVNGQFTEVICTNSDLELYRTREFYKSYRLNFEKATR